MSKILQHQIDLTARFEAETKARAAESKELWVRLTNRQRAERYCTLTDMEKGMLDVLNHNIKCLLEADDIENEDVAYIKGSLKYLVGCLGPVGKARMAKK